MNATYRFRAERCLAVAMAHERVADRLLKRGPGDSTAAQQVIERRLELAAFARERAADWDWRASATVFEQVDPLAIFEN